MGVGWFHSFLLRVLQNLLTENERRLTPAFVINGNPNHIYMKEQLDLISLKDELTIDSHRIEDHSVFGDYSQAENRVTNALLKILKIAGPDLIDMLIDKFGGEVKNPMPDILTQVPLSLSYPKKS